MKLFICGLSEVEDLLQKNPEITQCISIGVKEDRIPNFPPSIRVLRLDMEDVSFPTNAREIKSEPKKSDIKKIWEFSKGIDLENDSVLVHCFAGQSRSTAVACMLKVLEFGNSKQGIEKAVQDVYTQEMSRYQINY